MRPPCRCRNDLNREINKILKQTQSLRHLGHFCVREFSKFQSLVTGTLSATVHSVLEFSDIEAHFEINAFLTLFKDGNLRKKTWALKIHFCRHGGQHLDLCQEMLLVPVYVSSHRYQSCLGANCRNSVQSHSWIRLPWHKKCHLLNAICAFYNSNH